MTGIITSLPPLVEQPPGNNSNNPAGLPGVTYTAAIPILPQTWTGLQTFTDGSVQFAGSTSGNTFLNATAIASGTVILPAITGSDTLLANNNTATVTNKSIDGLQNTITNVPTGSLDPDLQAIAALTGTGIASRTAADTWALRTLTAPAAGITIANPAGVAGNPTFALANDLAALEGLASTGIAARTAADTWAVRTIAGTASEITVTNGDGVAGAPTISIPTALTFTGKTITGGTYSGAVSFNGNIWTAGTGTLTLGAGKTATISNTLTFNGTDGITLTFTGTDTIVGRASVDTLTGAKTFNDGKLILAGLSSGNTTLKSGAAAGSSVITLPVATDTLMGTATTDTLTNKTFDTAGTGNSFSINGVAATANTGTGSVVRATSPTLVTPALGTPTALVLTSATGLPLSGLTTQAAYTFVGNNTGGSAVPTAVDIAALTAKASPASTDLVMISDQAASGAWKKVTISSLASAGSVSSIAGNTGAFTLSSGLTNSTNDIRIANYVAPSTWTPSDGSGAALTFTSVTTLYSRYDKLIIIQFRLTYPATANGSNAVIAGLPVASSSSGATFGVGVCQTSATNFFISQPFMAANGTSISLFGTSGAQATNANLSGAVVTGTLTYITN